MSTHIHTQTCGERDREGTENRMKVVFCWLGLDTSQPKLENAQTHTHRHTERNGESRIDCKMFHAVLKTAAVHASISSQSPSVWHYSIVNPLNNTRLCSHCIYSPNLIFLTASNTDLFFWIWIWKVRSGPLLYVVLDQVHFQFLTTAVRTVTSEFMWFFLNIWHANCLLSVLISHSLNTQKRTAMTED